jgi:hypothetical protein
MEAQDTPFQSYDPMKLVVEVQDLLRSHGLRPAFPDGSSRLADTGASMLLRGLGVTPGIDAVAHYTRSTEQIWDENQDVH